MTAAAGKLPAPTGIRVAADVHVSAVDIMSGNGEKAKPVSLTEDLELSESSSEARLP